MSLLLLGCSVALALLLAGVDPQAKYQLFQIVSTSWLIPSATADVLIAVILIWYLVRIININTRFILTIEQKRGKKAGIKESNEILDRIIRSE
jgi:hypothetical protein